MQYKTDELLKQALEAIEKHPDIVFIQDVIVELPCCYQTFYTHFPADSNGLDTIKKTLSKNRTKLKKQLRHKWYNNDNPTLQVALYKLIANNDELQRLSVTYEARDSKNPEVVGFKFVKADEDKADN